jgi:NitT/TauT family transport system substrate-binding protein
MAWMKGTGMLTRRRFGQSLGAAALGVVAAPGILRAKPSVLRLGNAAGVNDAQLSFLTIGQHPKLGYYAAEGVDIEVVNMSSASQTLQALATGSVEFATLGATTYLPIYAKNPALDIIGVYNWLRQSQVQVGVKPDSPITSIADLKGKRIGIRNQGDTGYFGLQAMFEELGYSPTKDAEYISVGSGGPAGAALYGDRIDALAIWDGEMARVELAGFKMRFLPNTPGLQKLFGAAYGISRTSLKNDRERYVGMFRAMAKATIVAGANPELAVRLHWQVYPESKPKGKSEEEAMREALYILASRKDKWFAAPWQADKRMGASTAEEWQAQIRYAHLEDQIKDPGVLFTNELIADINNFDRAAVEQTAKTLTL